MYHGEKFYRTVIKVEVLSEDPYHPQSLKQIARDTYDGDCSGHWEVESSQEVPPAEMAKLLEKQGSDPAFLLGDEWNEPHIRVEYDLEYYGGDYSKVGQFAYLHADTVEEIGVEEAFRQATGIDPVHIIHYTSDEFFTAEGEEWVDEDAE